MSFQKTLDNILAIAYTVTIGQDKPTSKQENDEMTQFEKEMAERIAEFILHNEIDTNETSMDRIVTGHKEVSAKSDEALKAQLLEVVLN